MNPDEKKLLLNEIHSPIFEKKEIISLDVRSVFQLLDAMILNDKGTLNSYKTTAKTLSTMEKKVFIPLYAEHLSFLVTRCSWKMTRSYDYYTFEQRKFKNHFVIMNQVARQNAKSSVEKEFYKLMNNSNFDYGCRNNAENCSFKPIFEKLEELPCAEKYQNVFDANISDFVSSRLSVRQIEDEYLNKIFSLDPQDEYFEARKNSL